MPEAAACTLGGGALECSAKVVAAPIADADGDGSFDGLAAGVTDPSMKIPLLRPSKKAGPTSRRLTMCLRPMGPGPSRSRRGPN